jgi:hypothetical protein
MTEYDGLVETIVRIGTEARSLCRAGVIRVWNPKQWTCWERSLVHRREN